MSEAFSSAIERGASEEIRSQRLQEAFERYQSATAHYGKMLKADPAGDVQDPVRALTLARNAASESLSEYNRLLKIAAGLATRTKEN